MRQDLKARKPLEGFFANGTANNIKTNHQYMYLYTAGHAGLTRPSKYYKKIKIHAKSQSLASFFVPHLVNRVQSPILAISSNLAIITKFDNTRSDKAKTTGHLPDQRTGKLQYLWKIYPDFTSSQKIISSLIFFISRFPTEGLPRRNFNGSTVGPQQ